MTGVLDLLLRWATIRFSEKNSSVLTKILVLLQTIIVKLNESDYRMLNFEAYAFLPHLAAKLGESRQEVRDTVHTMIRYIHVCVFLGAIISSILGTCVSSIRM